MTYATNIVHHVVDRNHDELLITAPQLALLLRLGWISPYGLNPGAWRLTSRFTVIDVRLAIDRSTLLRR